jgi:hypothetical protein
MSPSPCLWPADHVSSHAGAPPPGNGTIRSSFGLLCIRCPSGWRGRPSGAHVPSYKGPASLLHVVSRVGAKSLIQQIKIAMQLLCHSLLLVRFQSNLPHALASLRVHAHYADAYRLPPLRRLPYRKKRIGNLQQYALASPTTVALGLLRCHCEGQERK